MAAIWLMVCSHGHGRGDVLRFGYLLEESTQGDGEIEHDVVDDVEHARDPRAARGGVAGEHQNGGGIFDAEELALADTVDGPPDERVEEPVDRIVDHEEDGNGVDREPEMLDQQEQCENDEYLPPRAEKKGQQVKQPIFPAENHFFALNGQFLVRRIEEQAPDAGEHAQDAHDEEHHRIRQKIGAEKHEDRRREAAARRKAAELAHDHGRGADIEILEEQGLVDGLKKVEAEGHQQRRQDDRHERGEKAGQRRAEAGRQRGYRGHPVLFHDEEQGDDQKSEQSRHFAQRLHKAVVRRRKMGAFHRKVRVEECPPLIAERRTQRQEEQEKVHARVRALRGVRRKHGCILKGWCGKRKYSGESRVILNARKSERFA